MDEVIGITRNLLNSENKTKTKICFAKVLINASFELNQQNKYKTDIALNYNPMKILLQEF